jgi:hypothetical protein
VGAHEATYPSDAVFRGGTSANPATAHVHRATLLLAAVLTLGSRATISGQQNFAAPLKSLWPNSVTHVLGTICYLRVRAAQLKNGGGGRTRTCDLLRVKERYLFQRLYQFYPSIPVFIHLGNLLRSQTHVIGPVEGRVLAQS